MTRYQTISSIKHKDNINNTPLITSTQVPQLTMAVRCALPSVPNQSAYLSLTLCQCWLCGPSGRRVNCSSRYEHSHVTTTVSHARLTPDDVTQPGHKTRARGITAHLINSWHNFQITCVLDVHGPTPCDPTGLLFHSKDVINLFLLNVMEMLLV